MKHIRHCRLILTALLLALPVSARAGTHEWNIGVQGFRDRYREPFTGGDVTIHTDYGALSGGYTYREPGFMANLDLRGSYGLADYHSTSGKLNNISEYEAELRGLIGTNFFLFKGRLEPYTGLGGRYFFEAGDGKTTDTGFGAYDRRIYQIYIPAGVDWQFRTGAWTLTPTLEYDQLVYGDVFSRLKPFIGYNPDNHQHNGYGVRGDFMVGHRSQKYRWEAGPFFRYWNINDSEIVIGPDGSSGEEPHNRRYQIGLGAKVFFK